MTALEPVRKWDHLYCAVKACGYPLTPYPPEASQGWCTACGHSYEYVNVIEEGTRLASKSQHDGLVLKKDTAELSKGFPFALEDPSVRSGVEWLQKAASGGVHFFFVAFSWIFSLTFYIRPHPTSQKP